MSVTKAREIIVRHHKYAWILTSIVLLVVGGFFFRKEFIQAATYTFTQSSWAGGVTANTATHTSNQTGWTEYSATSTSLTAGAGGVSLPLTSSLREDDGLISYSTVVGGTTCESLVSDASGNIYCSIESAWYVKKVTPAGVASTFASTGSTPKGLAFDTSGNLYVANNYNYSYANTVSKVTPAGVVSTFATVEGSPYGLIFDTSGNLYVSNNASSTISKVTPAGVVSTFATGLSGPQNLALDTSGNLYVANYTGNTISKITPAGAVSTFATGLSGPQDLKFDTSGNLYVTNRSGNTISKITPAGAVSTFATGLSAPYGLAFDISGNLYVANSSGNTISKITPAGVVSTFVTTSNYPKSIAFDALGNLYVAYNSGGGTVAKFLAATGGFEAGTHSSTAVAGSGTSASVNIAGTATTFATVGSGPTRIAVDTSGNIYTTNYSTNTISKVTPSGTATTFATVGSYPNAMAFDTSGNLYVAVYGGSIKKVTPSGTVTTFANDGIANTYNSIAFDSAGNLYTAHINHTTIRKITPDGTITVFATSADGYPTSLVFDTADNLYIANSSSGTNTVSKVTPAGVVSTFATGLSQPIALAFDVSGNLYVANYSGGTVSKVTPAGVVSTFATVGAGPRALTFDALGNLYTANGTGNTVSRITPAGVVATYADTGTAPYGLVFSPSGYLYVANYTDNNITKVAIPYSGTDSTLSAKTDYATGSIPKGVAVSPDGTSVYVANGNSATVSMYTRNTSTGALSAKTDYATGTLPIDVAVSPDGASVYVTNNTSNTVSMYSRNISTGALSAKTDYATGTTPQGVAVSPDGTSVYVTNRLSSGATISMFPRDTSTGALSAKTDYATASWPQGVVVSPDGTSVYVVNYGSTVSMFPRNISTGALSTKTDYATGNFPGSFNGVAISPDGVSVYVTNYEGYSVSMYSRTISTGALSAKTDYATGGKPLGITVSPDGTSVYAVNGNSVSVFPRNVATGALSARTDYASAAGATDVAVSPDGTSVYATGTNANAVSMFSRYVYTSGTFTSAVIDTGASSAFTTLDYTSTLNSQTLTVDARAGNTATPDGTWTAWQTGISSGGSISGLSGNRYFQYRANLSSSKLSTTPTLDSVTVNYGQYASSGNLTSSSYDTVDASNLINNISWTASGTSGTEVVKFQVRSSPDNAAWSNWCGPSITCDGTDYFTTSTGEVGGLSSSHPLRSGANDRYLQYKVFLTSGGAATPTLTQVVTQYVVNAPPAFDATYGTNGIVVSQVSDSGSADWGKVTISYKIRDTDTTTGTVNPGYVTPSFEYSTNSGTSWTALTTGLAAGDTSNKAVESTNYTTYTATWTASSTLVAYNTTMKIRVTLNDNEAANNTGSATSAVFTVDPVAPVISSAVIDSSAGASTAVGNTVGTITLTITDDSTKQYRLCNDSSFPTTDAEGNSCAWTTLAATISGEVVSSWVFTGGSADEPVYLQTRDALGNVTAQTLVAPAMPSNFSYNDTSNVPLGVYREFLSWSPFVATTSSAFGSYKVYHSLDDFATSPSLLSTINDSAVNYYSHTITSATSSIHYYKVVAVNTNGDISNYTAALSDTPDGAGNTDTRAPVITSVSVADAGTKSSSANVVFTTDELAIGSVTYASYSGSAPTTCPSGTTVSATSYVTSQSVYLTGLTANTSYALCVVATDIIGNASTPVWASHGTTFTTTGGPIISNVTEREITDTSALIFWNTSTSSTSYVKYAASTAGVSAGTEVGSATMVPVSDTAGIYQHQVGLTGLTTARTYYYQVTSVDSLGNSSTDDNSGQYYSFMTLRDTTPPTISGIATPVLSSDAAVVVWQTDEPATSQVLYDIATTGRSKYTTTDTTKSIYHVVTLSSATSNAGVTGGTNALTPETTYYYAVKSADAAGNTTTSDEETLTTTATGNVTIVAVSVTAAPTTSGTTPDTTPPTISNVAVGDITPFGATVSFTTSEDTVAGVDFGKDLSYGSNTADFSWSTVRSILLRGLTLGTDYHFRVKAIDKAGNTGVSSDQTFKTTFLSENLADIANVENIEAFQKEIEAAIESILPSLVPPFVAKPQITEITESSAKVSFKTNIKSFPVVVYAEDGAYDETKENPYTSEVSDTTERATTHELTLTGLKGNTKYHVQARGFSLPKVIGKSVDVTFSTKTSKITGSIVERKKDSFTVVWTTEQPTSSIVEFKNIKTGITERKVDDAKKTSHSMKIENLPSGVAYEVSLSGLTEQGNVAEAGAPISVTTSRDVTPPEISGFKVDNALVPGRTDRIQTIVSWTTDEPSNSAVYFEEGAGTAGDTRELANKNEVLDSYVTAHSVILPNLKPGTIYRLKVVSVDDSGNEGSFGPRTVITPRQTESITDIIFKNFEDSFKFLRKI